MVRGRYYMRSGLTVSFLGIERSAAVEARIRELWERLRRYHDRIGRCHMTVTRSDGDGAKVFVKIHVSVPAAQVHAEGVGPADADDAGAFLAAGDAFESARRQLSELQRDGRQYSLGGIVRDSRIKN